MTEFAILAPLLLFVIFGVFEMALLMYGVGVARFAAGEAARVLAQEGNQATADQDALSYIRAQTPIGGANIRVNHIDVYRVNQDGLGNLSQDTTGCGGFPCVNRYNLSGSFYSGGLVWDPQSRFVGAAVGDYLGIDVNFTYAWKEGIFASVFGPNVTTTATVWLRLEPQVY